MFTKSLYKRLYCDSNLSLYGRLASERPTDESVVIYGIKDGTKGPVAVSWSDELDEALDDEWLSDFLLKGREDEIDEFGR